MADSGRPDGVDVRHDEGGVRVDVDQVLLQVEDAVQVDILLVWQGNSRPGQVNNLLADMINTELDAKIKWIWK